jgi:hypothetical protein
MDIKYVEFDNLENNNDKYLTSNNYWQQNKNIEPKKKVKFGYDDILSSINLVVNKNGVLQYMTPNPNVDNNQNNSNTYNQNTHSQNTYTKHTYEPTVNLNNQPNKKLSVDPQVKNSAIYNKYFKNYKDPNEVKEEKIPKTREELRKMLIEENIKRVLAQKRLEQVKSRKMFFNATGPQIPIYTSQNQPLLNKLFKFK